MNKNEFLELENSQQNILIESMSEVLLKDTFSDQNIIALTEEAFSNTGIKINDIKADYEIDKKHYYCEISFTNADMDFSYLLKEMHLSSVLKHSDYNELCVSLLEEPVDEINIAVTKEYKKIGKIYIESSKIYDVLLEALQDGLDQFLDTIFDNIASCIRKEHDKLSSDFNYIFDLYNKDYEIENLYDKLFGGAIINV